MALLTHHFQPHILVVENLEVSSWVSKYKGLSLTWNNPLLQSQAMINSSYTLYSTITFKLHPLNFPFSFTIGETEP